MPPDDRIIVLQDTAGERTNFDPSELQNVLMRCFLDAGLQEICYLASDIALAVEYAFVHSGRRNLVFAAEELRSAVLRILEDTGLSDVASMFRRSGDSGAVRCADAVSCRRGEDVAEVLRRYFAGTETHLQNLSDRVRTALQRLRIERAMPGLIVELARHFEEAATMFDSAPPFQPPAADEDGTVKSRRESGRCSVDEYYLVSSAEIASALSPETGRLVNDGVIRLHGVSRILPSVRFFCFLNRRGCGDGISAPLTELALAPRLFDLGRHLEHCREVTQRLFADSVCGSAAPLPVYLSLPDMADFVERNLDVLRGRPCEQLARELAQMLASGLTVPVEKISIPFTD